MPSTAYRDRIALSKARLETALQSDARRFGHHGIANFILVARARHNTAITEDYARILLEGAGYTPAKP